MHIIRNYKVDCYPMQIAVKYGHIHIIKWLSGTEYNIIIDPYYAYKMACKYQYFKAIRLVCKLNIVTTTLSRNWLIQHACRYGHLRLAKWLYDIGCDPTADNNCAIRVACQKGHLRVAKWLYSIGCDPKDNNDCTVKYTAMNGHLAVVQWLCKMGCDPRADDNAAVYLAQENGHRQVYNFLRRIGCRD